MNLSSFTAVVRTLNEAPARFVVVGGMAVVAHGYGRMTVDLDIVLDLTEENVVRALRSLQGLGYRPRVPVTPEQFADAELRESWIRDKGMVVLNLYSDDHRDTPIDIFVREPFVFDDVWRRALVEELDDGVQCRFVDIRTLIEMKRSAGRTKDLDDIENLSLLADEGE